MALACHIGAVIYVNSPGLGGSVEPLKWLSQSTHLGIVHARVYVSDPSLSSPFVP